MLSDKEAGDLWSAIIDGTRFMPYYTNFLKVAMVFGCRTQEIRLSEWNEWDMSTWMWTVPKTHSKGGDKIIGPVPEAMRPFVQELHEENKSTGLFLGELKGSEAVSQWGRTLYKRFDHTEPWNLHDLRRTLATHLNNLGIAPHVVEQLLGHSMSGVMAIYNRSIYLPEKLDALNKWCERLDILIDKKYTPTKKVLCLKLIVIKKLL